MVIIIILEMMVISIMAKQTIRKTKSTYRKSKTTTKNGRKHCPTCGKFI